jgi:predicted nucleic acid-binding protein
MVDTNVLISALLFPGPKMNALMSKIMTEYQLVLSSYIIEELMNVVHRKFPDMVEPVDILLNRLPYELVYTPKLLQQGLIEIRDAKDYPILYSAVTEGVDVFITGGKDFSDVDVEKPIIMTPAEFLDKY